MSSAVSHADGTTQLIVVSHASSQPRRMVVCVLRSGGEEIDFLLPLLPLPALSHLPSSPTPLQTRRIADRFAFRAV
jgi:hypothetical protein